MSEPAVLLEGVGKRFDESWVLQGIDMVAPVGSIVGLIGPSGCGKTTAVRLVNGTYSPDEGRITTLGRDPRDLSLRERQRIGYLPQRPVLFESLTLWENLNFHASLNGVRLRRRARLREMLEFVELDEDTKKKVSEASGGMQRRLALAATLAHAPALAMLDEPTAGIDPILRARFWEHFRSLSDDGTTLFVTTQYIGEAAHCDLVGLLADGRLLHFSPPDELRRAAYGGTVVRVVVEDPIEDGALHALSDTSLAHDVDRESPTAFRAVVDDAPAALPKITELLQNRGVAVTESEEVAVDYDDAFVRLVETHRDDQSKATHEEDDNEDEEEARSPARQAP